MTGEVRLVNVNQRVEASRDEQPEDLAASGSGCDRISLHAALMKQNIMFNGREICGISDKPRVTRRQHDDHCRGWLSDSLKV